MKMKSSILAMLISSLTCGAAFASQVNLTEIKVRDHLYPENFKQELQVNIDFFKDGVGVDPKTAVPYDTIFIKNGKPEPMTYTNTTEIGLYLNILVEAEKAGNADALVRITETLTTLEKAPKWKGLFYWPYEIENGQLAKNKDEIVPAVDNSNAIFALMGVAGAYLESTDPVKKDIVKRIEKIISDQKEGWLALYDKDRQMLYAGYQTKTNAILPYYVDRKANESRLSPLLAALVTKDEGANAISENAFNKMETYAGAYELDGKKYHPLLTWDGSYFQAMLPAIWLEESRLIPNYKMIEDLTFLHIYYAARHNLPLLSASATTNDEYASFGVPFLAESKVKYNNKLNGDGKTGTPHASALSFIVKPQVAIRSLKNLKAKYPAIESPYGWYDAIDTEGRISTKILSLDQGMFVGAFLHKEINADVARYLVAKGYMPKIEQMYKSFVPKNIDKDEWLELERIRNQQ